MITTPEQWKAALHAHLNADRKGIPFVVAFNPEKYGVLVVRPKNVFELKKPYGLTLADVIHIAEPDQPRPAKP